MDNEDCLLITDLPYHLRKCAKMIGIDNLIKLCDGIDGDAIRIPSKKSLIRYSFPRRIKNDRLNGMSIAELEEKYSCSDDMIYHYLKK